MNHTSFGICALCALAAAGTSHALPVGPAPINLSTVGTAVPGAIFQGREGFNQAGSSVAGVGDVNADGRGDLLIGAFAARGTGPTAEGSNNGESYLIYGPSSGSFPALVDLGSVGSTTAGAAFFGTEGGAFAGTVAPLGDVNHDGRDDVLIGAHRSDATAFTSGTTYLAYGQPEPQPLSGTIRLSNIGTTVSGASFRGEGFENMSGISVNAAGDFNGDGIDDILIGAPRANVVVNGVSRVRAGKTYVIYGQAGSAPFAGPIDLSQVGVTVPGAVFVGTAANFNSGASVAAAGDINGDAVGDLLIGSPVTGTTYLIYGQKTNPYSGDVDMIGIGFNIPGAVIRSTSATTDFGIVSPAGDVDHDGLGDFLVGAPSTSISSNTRIGQAFLIYGKSAAEPGGALSGDLSSANVGGAIRGAVFTGLGGNWQTGSSVAGVGDVNADGFGDFLIGSPNADAAGIDTSGQVHLIFGQRRGLLQGSYSLSTVGAQLNGLTFNGFNEGGQAGRAVGAAGDINGDGAPDFLISAYQAPFDHIGQVYLIYGTVPEPSTVVSAAVFLLAAATGRRRYALRKRAS